MSEFTSAAVAVTIKEGKKGPYQSVTFANGKTLNVFHGKSVQVGRSYKTLTEQKDRWENVVRCEEISSDHVQETPAVGAAQADVLSACHALLMEIHAMCKQWQTQTQ